MGGKVQVRLTMRPEALSARKLHQAAPALSLAQGEAAQMSSSFQTISPSLLQLKKDGRNRAASDHLWPRLTGCGGRHDKILKERQREDASNKSYRCNDVPRQLVASPFGLERRGLPLWVEGSMVNPACR